MLADMVRRSMLLGLGALSLTKERAERLADELVKKGEMTRDEARNFVDQVVEKGKQEKEEIKKAVKEELEGWGLGGGIATKADINRLEEQIRKIEEKLNQVTPGQ